MTVGGRVGVTNFREGLEVRSEDEDPVCVLGKEGSYFTINSLYNV